MKKPTDTDALLSGESGGTEWTEKIKAAKNARKQGEERIKQNPRPKQAPALMKRNS